MGLKGESEYMGHPQIRPMAGTSCQGREEEVRQTEQWGDSTKRSRAASRALFIEK
jgi:hypothetical protein